MEPTPLTSRNTEIGNKEITFRKGLNIYGTITILGLILSIFTNPISINESMQIFYNEDLMMDEKKLKEFSLFIFGAAFVYFSLVNLYYKYMR
ncbi:hypothetical protein J2Z64_002689 [Oceanobacillus polygoni]|uniref:Uncharacterized protein n=1 Tax=Oceanobacillus polygoni TaxID=1235259 RepID=A0A9X0YW46_9BACI|nr:hypothetical protein [Oceanobacillus polygoni]